jgi:hypothetical protein
LCSQNQQISTDNKLDVNDDEQQKNESNKKKGKNKGRNPASKYSRAERIYIKHPDLSSGDRCPMKLCTGRVYKVKPGSVIRIVGGKMAEAKNYILEKLKCNLCSTLFAAELPENAGIRKYDARFKATLMIHKYYLGLPFHRMEKMQSYLGVPLPDSTQWYLTDETANDVYFQFRYIEYAAAQGRAIFGDDTGAKILAIAKRDNERTGTFTSAFISVVGEHKIYLFYSGIKHAGENILSLLEKRNTELDRILYMCDALSRNISNISEEFKVIIINCLLHGRRNFIDVEPHFPEECDFVIKSLALVYQYDKESKEQRLSDEERLKYHQKHSEPVMVKLKIWCKEQLNIVEPNNGLAKSIKYMLRHWDKLTRFLEVEGAALDNNCCEEILKIPIRVRKNSYFFATEHGAFVGGMITSLIVTAVKAGANPIEYLTALQTYNKQARKAPQYWLPWNYQEAIIKLQLISECSSVAV